MEFKKVVIHIGLHKTGTTFIQETILPGLSTTRIIRGWHSHRFLMKADFSKQIILSDEGISGRLFGGTYYEDAALRGIASTCVIEDNLLPYIKQIKRQGDLFLIEWNDDFDNKLFDGEVDLGELRKEGSKVQLTPEQYFGLLVSES